MKKFIAKVIYKGHKFIMPVSGKDEKSVMKQVTDFYIDLLEEDESAFEIELEERK